MQLAVPRVEDLASFASPVIALALGKGKVAPERCFEIKVKRISTVSTLLPRGIPIYTSVEAT